MVYNKYAPSETFRALSIALKQDFERKKELFPFEGAGITEYELKQAQFSVDLITDIRTSVMCRNIQEFLADKIIPQRPLF